MKRLRVEVTNALPFNDSDLRNIITRFKREGLSFGLRRAGEAHYVLWREMLADEKIKHTKLGAIPCEIAEEAPPPIKEFVYLWEDGNIVKGLGLLDINNVRQEAASGSRGQYNMTG